MSKRQNCQHHQRATQNCPCQASGYSMGHDAMEKILNYLFSSLHKYVNMTTQTPSILSDFSTSVLPKLTIIGGIYIKKKVRIGSKKFQPSKEKL